MKSSADIIPGADQRKWTDFLTRHHKLVVFVFVTVFYLISNLQFFYGLDDSVNYINAQRVVGSKDLSGVLEIIKSLFFNKQVAGLYRPARTTYTFLLVYISKYIPFFPDLVNALTAGLLSCLLLTLAEQYFSRPVSVCGTLWFFGCIPVVAMGNVVLVSQFLTIIGLYLPLIFWGYFVDTRRLRWLLCLVVVILLFSFYAEAILVTPCAIAIYGVFRLLNKEIKLGVISIVLAGFLAVLALSNVALLTGRLSDIYTVLREALITRGYAGTKIIDRTLPGIFLQVVGNYYQIYRPTIFSAIFFSVSPYLYIVSYVAFTITLLLRRKFVVFAIAVLIALSPLVIRPCWTIGLSIVLICVYYRNSYPLFVSMIIAVLLILGPLFVIDVHITYMLVALVLLLFETIFDAYKTIHNAFAKYCFASVNLLLPVILVSNYFSGAYFAAAVANSNKVIAERFVHVLDTGVILTNFRHIFDFYMYSNSARLPDDYREEVYFTATVPLYNETRAVRDEKALEQWFSKYRGKKPMYFFLVDHNRLPGKVSFHGAKFLDRKTFYKHFIGSDILDVQLPFFDPGFLLTDYFYKHGLVAGFIGYPVFPDMIDDIGVEYGFFTKRLFAVYRLFKIDFENFRIPVIGDDELFFDTVRRNYHGFNIYMINGRYYAIPSQTVQADLKRMIHRRYSPTLFSESYDELVHKILTFSFDRIEQTTNFIPPPELIEEGYKGFNIILYDDRLYGLAQDEGAFDIRKVQQKKYKRCVAGRSVAEIKTLVSIMIADDTTCRLVDSSYYGFNIFCVNGRYFALPEQIQQPDLNKVLAGEYREILFANSREDLKAVILKK